MALFFCGHSVVSRYYYCYCYYNYYNYYYYYTTSEGKR